MPSEQEKRRRAAILRWFIVMSSAPLLGYSALGNPTWAPNVFGAWGLIASLLIVFQLDIGRVLLRWTFAALVLFALFYSPASWIPRIALLAFCSTMWLSLAEGYWTQIAFSRWGVFRSHRQ
jgi:hypothetical protein